MLHTSIVGNLDRAEECESSERDVLEYNLWLASDCAGTEYQNSNRTWFYFSVTIPPNYNKKVLRYVHAKRLILLFTSVAISSLVFMVQSRAGGCSVPSFLGFTFSLCLWVHVAFVVALWCRVQYDTPLPLLYMNRLKILNMNRQARLYHQGLTPIIKVVPGRGQWERLKENVECEVSRWVWLAETVGSDAQLIPIRNSCTEIHVHDICIWMCACAVVAGVWFNDTVSWTITLSCLSCRCATKT